jgi:nucleoside-diphosphate-sugar epimerase
MTNNSLRAWITAVERGLFFYIGKSGAMANYVHVEDVAKALRRCAEDERAHLRIYNLSYGCSIEAFVAAMCLHLGKPMNSFRIPEYPVRLMAVIGNYIPGFPLSKSRVNALTCRACYPSDRIRYELGFRPSITAENGLSRLIEAMKMESYVKLS